MTPDKLKAEIRQQLQAMKLVDTDIKPTVTVTDADVPTSMRRTPRSSRSPRRYTRRTS